MRAAVPKRLSSIYGFLAMYLAFNDLPLPESVVFWINVDCTFISL